MHLISADMQLIVLPSRGQNGGNNSIERMQTDSLKIYFDHGPQDLVIWAQNTSISEHGLLPVGPILVATLILSHVLKEYK